MGIKTNQACRFSQAAASLKNLPTTWGLRRDGLSGHAQFRNAL